jgi:hypothetical protein
MENRKRTSVEGDSEDPNHRYVDVLTIGEILKELLTEYQARFPTIRISIIETPINVL